MVDNWKEMVAWVVGVLCAAAVVSIGVTECTGCEEARYAANQAQYIRCIDSSDDVRECRQ